MAKKKLLEDIKQKPARFYRLPGDVMRDRRFADAERLEILHAWLADPAADALKSQIETAMEELKSRIPARAPGHAAE
jgi:hypothetical protein